MTDVDATIPGVVKVYNRPQGVAQGGSTMFHIIVKIGPREGCGG